MITRDDLNDEQKVVYDSIMDFIEHGDVRNHFYSLKGKAGTGKTYILSAVATKLYQMGIAVTAIAHKAKKEIRSRIDAPGVGAFSVAGILGMKMNLETGEFTDEWGGKEPPIVNYQLIIVDESSMIPQEVVDKIMFKKLPTAAVIFAGDIGQIRPIRKKAKLDDVSPTFLSSYNGSLVTRVRQGAGHPILEHSDVFWDMSQSGMTSFAKIEREHEVNSVGGIYYLNDMKGLIKYLLPEFRYAVDNKDTNHIKAVTYRNEVKSTINKLIREGLFNTDADFVVGDLMIMNDNYRVPMVDGDLFDVEDEEVSPYTDMDNSEEFVVTDFRRTTKFIEGERFHIYELEGEGEDGKPVFIPIIHPESLARYNTFKSELFNDANATKGPDRSKKFKKWDRAKSALAYADYGYSITTHKSQGSTYKIVVVNIYDMLRAPTIAQEIATLIYTGMTRAKQTCYMVNRNFKKPLPPEFTPHEVIDTSGI